MDRDERTPARRSWDANDVFLKDTPEVRHTFLLAFGDGERHGRRAERTEIARRLRQLADELDD